MTSKTVSPPLHRRHDLPEVTAAIKRRYQVFRTKLGPQVEILQHSDSFRLQCAQLYDLGYKDWMILGAVYNRLLQTKLTEQGVDMRDTESAAATACEITIDPQPICEARNAEHFCGHEFMLFLHCFNFVALASYGFQLRRRTLQPEAIERFLRERLNYFEMDLPHKALFGNGAGTWPDDPPD